MNNSEALVAEGRVWLFADDNINTDLMMPQSVFAKSLEEQMRNVFATYRPGWVEQVRAGDILVGGRNFGTGSSRPGSLLLKRLGIAALVAESINGLFYRNCINYALPAPPQFILSGDVNNDGKLDIVAVGAGPLTVTTLIQ